MNNYKLLEILADIAYHAGEKEYYSGDSRSDMASFIGWAKEFAQFHQDTDWGQTDYLLTIEAYAEDKLATTGIYGKQRLFNV